MAKPISTGRASCSTRSPSHTRPETIHSYRRRHRRRSPSSSSSPSSALLSLLATICASSTSVLGSPAPPSFLCPSLDDPTLTRNTPSRGTTTPKVRRALKLSTTGASSTRHVPAKFEQDNDTGRWQKAQIYSLYGSTVCLTCNSTTSVPSFGASSSVPNPTQSSTTSYNIHDELPPGWKPRVTSGGRTTLILALSLVLAFLNCFLIIGCLFWRKTRRRKRKQNDIEMKVRKRRRSHSLDDVRGSMLAMEREVKAKQKIWARASARWKANARYTARQRRGKKNASTTRFGSPLGSNTSLDRMEDTQSTLQIPTSSSPPLSRRSSLVSLYAVTPVEDATTGARSFSQETQSEIIVPAPLTSIPPSPPAYHLRISEIRISSAAQEGDEVGDKQPTSSPLSPHNPQYSSSSNYRPSDHSNTSMDFPPQPISIHAAHVATDDKGLLARLADLASAPPPDGANSSQTDPTTFHVSVPIWQDEELEDFKNASYDPTNCRLPPSRYSSRSSSPAPLFPPPPSKGKMAAPSFYDYPYSFEDISLEPDPGPSAPPFEEQPSCPLIVTDIAPSAPPLSEAEATSCVESYASAPTHDWEASVAPTLCQSSDAAEKAHRQDTISTSDHTECRSSGPSADSSIPTVQGPVASDGTPPCYYP